MQTIRLAIADDEVLIRRGLELIIRDFEGIELVMEAGNGQELLDQLEDMESLPDVVIMDMRMPVMNGVETAKKLTEAYSDIRIVVLSTYFSKAFVLNMLEIGAAAYLPKNTSPDEMEHTIRGVVEKGFYYNEEVMAFVRENLRKKKKPSLPGFEVDLTKREREVLQLICEQYTNSEIAEKLFISTRTVEGHRNNLLQKLNCRNTAGLVAVAIQRNLIQVNPSGFW